MPFDPSSLLAEVGAEQLEAFIDTMVLAADADGELSEDERARMVEAVATVARASSQDATTVGLEARISAARQKIDAGGRVELIDLVKQRLAGDNARKAALGMAIDITAADGIIRTTERELIMDLAEALGVDRDVAADLVRDITRD